VDQGSGIGGLADLALVHEKLLVKIRNDMPLVPAAILGCAVLTGTGAVFRSAKVERGSQVAVIGCGAIGISIIQAARIAGCSRIFAVDVVAAKLEQASTFGATDLTDASVVDPIASILDQTDGAGVNFSFEAIGHPATVNQAFGMLGIGGTAIIVGIFSPDAVVELHPRDYVNGEKSIRGSYLGSSNFRTEIPRLVDLYLSGTLLLDEMLSPRISLDDVSSGFEAMIGGRGLRPIVDFEIS
jgi:S-(hydroxymethyl)glutathione dehydrogenase/alcohol dehydrogenase